MRTLTQAYFSPERPLHLSFTHLVCRSAIEGNDPTWSSPSPRESRSTPAETELPCLREGRVGQTNRSASPCLLGEQEQRMDLSHPVHADNCFLDPDTGECWREPPAYTFRDYRWVGGLGDGGGTQRSARCRQGFTPHTLSPSAVACCTSTMISRGVTCSLRSPTPSLSRYGTQWRMGGPPTGPSCGVRIQNRRCPEANAGKWQGTSPLFFQPLPAAAAWPLKEDGEHSLPGSLPSTLACPFLPPRLCSVS